MCTEEGCERGPPAPAAPPAHRREGGGGTGEGGRRGWWHRVPVALVEVSPRPLQFGARTPRGSRPSPRHRSQEGAECRPVPRGQFGDSGRARSDFGGSEATPDLPARQRARRWRRGGRDCEQWPFVPRQHPAAPSPVPAPPGSSVPQSMAGEQGGSWLRGGRGSGGGPEWSPAGAVLRHAMGQGGERGTGAAPSRNLGAAPPAELSPQRAHKVPGLERGVGGQKVGARGAAVTSGTRVVPGAAKPLRPPAALASLRRSRRVPSRSTADIFIFFNYK